MTSARRSRRWIRLLALLLGLALIAAACGGDDGDTDEGTAEADDGTISAEPDESDAGDPVPGGKVIYGLEADSANPWTPAGVTCAISCHMVLRSVFDTLALFSDDQSARPNLLESMEPNEDYTQWTLTPRPGITFHDGTPFDANAIVVNLEAYQASFTTTGYVNNMESVAVSDDGSAAIVTAKAPWVSFPSAIAGRVGYVASPTWLAAVADGSGDATQPVGTGPFVFESYEAGNNFVATKNPDYWRDGLPYLDEIEFRFLPDSEARKNALLDGQITMMHTSSGDLITQLRDEDSVELTETSAYGETGYVLLNNALEDSPLNDIRIRRALAMSVDNQLLIDRRGGGLAQVANGPFSPDQMGYLEDSGYPEYDPDGARALVEEYKAEMGVDEVTLNFTTTTDPIALATAELYQQMIAPSGITLQLAQIEQSSFIGAALTGDFEMFAWRNHGGVDPADQRSWWHSDTARPLGDLGLNFGRVNDEVIDEQLDILQSNDDPDARREAAEEINRRFGEQVYNLWSSWTVWGIAKSPSINGLDDFTLPDGSPGIYGNGQAGSHQLAQLWISE